MEVLHTGQTQDPESSNCFAMKLQKFSTLTDLPENYKIIIVYNMRNQTAQVN